MQLARLSGVVAAECLDLVSERAGNERIEQIRERWMRPEMGCWHDEIVPGRLQRYEIQAQQASRGADANSDVGLMGGDGAGHFEMRPRDGLVASNVSRLHPGGTQPLIEQQPRSGSLFAVDQRDMWLGQIGGRADPFGISRPNQKPFLPDRERND